MRVQLRRSGLADMGVVANDEMEGFVETHAEPRNTKDT